MKNTCSSSGRLPALAALALACGAELAGAAGCGSSGRPPDNYRGDTEQLLLTVSPQITGCYTSILKGGAPTAQGSVTVRFVVEEGSGRIHEVRVDRARSTAPEAVQQCVTKELESLRLNPSDDQRGEATFSWDFTFKNEVLSQPPSTAAAAPSAPDTATPAAAPTDPPAGTPAQKPAS